MIVSRDGKRLISYWSLEGIHEPRMAWGASLWDVESGREMRQWREGSGMEQIVGFSPTDQKFITVKEGRPIALWDGASGELIREYK